MRESVVIKSTEELLRKIEDFNTKMKNENPKGIKKVIMSMDVKIFYPSLDPVKAAKVARIMLLKSTIDLKNVNIERLAKYVGKFCDFNEVKKENLTEVVWTKKKVPKKVKKDPAKKKKTKDEIEKETSWG